jgi:hypothetical protein
VEPAAGKASETRTLPDDDFAFGAVYFMANDREPDLDRVWRHAIHPLLEERFYGARRAEELKRDLGVAAMRTRLSGSDGQPRSPRTMTRGSPEP